MDYKLQTRDLNLFYGDFQALRNVTVAVKPRMITAVIGPSGCGKSTLLRCFNRMNEEIRGVRVSGEVRLDGKDVHGPGTDMPALRKRVGLVFQRPNPFPLSVFENVVYGLRVHGMRDKPRLQQAAEVSLRGTMLWETLKDKLETPALKLPAEQQQRLCISRVLAVEPEVLLMDEPCSALDPVATEHIEELMEVLAESYTIVIVTHNMQQAARVSQETGFMLLGELVEFGLTEKIFTNPSDRRTEDYVTGRYG
jgi:phosphate transport system ATP-binding protein